MAKTGENGYMSKESQHFSNFSKTRVVPVEAAPAYYDKDPESSVSESNAGYPRIQETKGSLAQFMEATAPQIIGGTNWFIRIFWLLAYIGATTIFVIQFINLVEQYLQYKVDTSLSLVRSSSATFPSVTLCNNSPVKKSMLEKVNIYSDLALLDDYVESEMIKQLEEDFGYDLPYTCDPEDFQCFNTKECISWDWVCDGVNNCEDGLDEGQASYGGNGTIIDCSSFVNPTINTTFSAYNPNNYCVDGLVECNITSEPVCAEPCDEITECSNGFDEMAAIGCRVERECGADVTLVTGTPQNILSDNYPNDYTNDQLCEYFVSSDPGTQISVTFNYVEVEMGNDKCNDYLVFHDGVDESGPVLPVAGKNRVCGAGTSPAEITSSGNGIYIKFQTDRSEGMAGFNITVLSASAKRAKRHIQGITKSKRDANKVRAMSEKLQKKREKRDAKVEKEREKRLRHLVQKEMQKKKRQRRSAGDYSDALTYNTDFWEADTYDAWLEAYDPYDHFDANLQQFDWISAYNQAEKPDFADFRSFALFTQNEVKWFGTQAVDFIAQCTYDGRDCDHTAFETYQNPKYGNCFLFNTILNQSPLTDGSYSGVRSTSKTGQQYGLKVTLFINEHEYIGVLSQNVGAQVLLTSSKTVPLPESEGIQLAAGFNTRIGIRQEAISRRGGKYGNCHTDWPTDSINFAKGFLGRWPFYSQKVCETYCIQTNIFTKCGCTDHYLEGFNSNKDTGDNNMCNFWNSTERTCIRGIYNDYRDGTLECPCYSQCETELYPSSSSIAEWPSPQFTPYLVQMLRKSSESEVIQDYLSGLLGSSDATQQALLIDPELLADELRKEFLRVEIYFQELNFQKLSESPSYTFTNLLSDFGGNIGLWIGWSVLTFCEIIILAFNLIKILFTKRAC